MPQPLTITLSPELAEKVRARAASHGYASESEYVEDQLAEAVEENPELEEWLRTVGVARYDAHDADPSAVLNGDQLRARKKQDELSEWIATEGVRRYDAMRADPSRAFTEKHAFKGLCGEDDNDE